MFIYLAELGLNCGMQDLHCVMVGSFTATHRLLVVAYWLSSCGTQAWLLCSMWDLSSPTKDQTFILCIARQILQHWATREVLLV